MDSPVVIVTGASRGIGRATALLLAAQGARVVATGRDADALASLQTGGTYLPADVRDPASAEAVVAHALASYGRLDGVVANAGVGHAGAFDQMDPARIAELVEVNVTAPMLLARAAVPVLGPTGALVFVTSIAAAVGVPGETVYSASKAAIEVFAELLREELTGRGITVSTVLPGVVATDFFTARGAAYDRRYPRPIPVERAAAVVVRALTDGVPRQIEPRWLAVPARFATSAPATYRRLARRFS